MSYLSFHAFEALIFDEAKRARSHCAEQILGYQAQGEALSEARLVKETVWLIMTVEKERVDQPRQRLRFNVAGRAEFPGA